MDENHLDLAGEFPEFKETIHTLKAQDAHFARLFAEYGELNRKIVRAEQRIELMSEEEEEGLRRQRMQLKDQLFATLKAAN